MKSTFGTSGFKRSLAAIAVSAVLGMSGAAQAAGSTGTVVGGIYGVPASGYTVTIKNPEIGFSREVTVDANGSFRFPQLAIGQYELTVTKDGKLAGKQIVRVSVGGTANAKFDLGNGSGVERIEVSGARVSAVDLSSADSGLTIGEMEFDRLPVGRNITSVALLAPGTVKGEGAFGNLASFSGSSVAENVCYINGMNVTDPDKGLGCGTIPFEFYKEFQVKTGGYSAQYGRSTGGVINAVSKSGTNEFEFGATAYYTPDYIGDGSEIAAHNGAVFRDTTNNSYKETNATISAGGPIIKDKLFFFAMYNPRDIQEKEARPSNLRTTATNRWRELDGDDAFWGAKLDWEITDAHRLSYFGFSNDQTRSRILVNYDAAKDVITTPADRIFNDELEDGGQSNSLTYSGTFGDSFNVSAMAGRYETKSSTIPGNLLCPAITDSRTSPAVRAQTCGTGTGLDRNEITRDIKRIDFEWAIMDGHLLRFGYDGEDIEANHTTQPAGDGAHVYNTVQPGATIAGTSYTNNTGAAHDWVSRRVFAGGGAFSTENYAYYVEDQWTINDQWFVTAGVRSDVAENKGKTGITFVKLDDQIAPRLGVTFDPNADGSSKVFANYGKYFFPIPVNTNYRTASGIRDITEYFRFTSINPADGRPQGLTLLDTAMNGSGAIPDPILSAAPEYSAQSVTEYILGYQRELNEEYSATIRATYRTTDNMGDDYCDREVDPTGDGNICTLFNPGKGHTFGKDEDHDGKVDPGSIRYYSAEEIGVPEGKRDYSSVQLELVHRAESLNWTAQYVWSHSYGNNEGGVNSDNYQTDTGVSSFLDFKASAVGASGDLPNDRRHAFKFYGSYALTDAWSVGWNSSLVDGRPQSMRGLSFPVNSPIPQPGYGDTYYVYDAATKTYLFNPRGSKGRMPWTFNLDASVSYAFTYSQLQGRVSLDIFNVLDTQQTLAVNELGETGSGTPNQFYGLTSAYQTPRQVRLGVSLDF
jgi:hypothetical protein